jgi:hypothetical protein
VFGRISGAIWHLEVKRGAGSKQWHPHIHGLCLLPRGSKLDGYELSDEWHRLTRDSFVVDCRRTNFGKAMVEAGQSADEVFSTDDGRELLLRDLCEVLKYCLKPDENSGPADIVHAYHTLFGKRLARTWGNLRGLKVEDELQNGQTTGLGPYFDYILRWAGVKGYELISTKYGIATEEN